jgi:NitT/TauT family transport system permease protein
MKTLSAALKPNQAISGTSARLLAGGWAAFMLIAWQLFATRPIPVPSTIPGAFMDLWNRTEIGRDLLSSLTLNLQAIALSSLISCCLAYLAVLAGLKPAIGFVSKLRFLGLTGLTFVFGLYFTGHALKLVLLTFGMTVFLLTSMLGVIANIPAEDFHYARTLRMGPWRSVWEIAVRGTLDQTIEAVRQNAAIGWMMLTMVEGLVRSEGGIGVLLLNGNKQFRLESVFALQLMILVIGLLQDYGLGVLLNITCPWSVLADKENAS